MLTTIAMHFFIYFCIGKRFYEIFAVYFSSAVAKIFAAVYGLLFIPMLFAFMPIHLRLNYIFLTIGAYWLGVYFYLSSFFILSVAIIALGKAFGLISNVKKARLHTGIVVAALTVAVSSYGFFNATRIVFVEYEVQLNRPLAGEPINIVFIGDLHLGSVRSERQLTRIVDGINSLEPDIVALVGDIFNDDFYLIRNPDRAEMLLREISATYGVFACLGNHDAGPTLGSMIASLERSNITLLKDEYVIIDERLILIGRLDPIPFGEFGHPIPFSGFDNLRRRELADIKNLEGNRLPVIVLDHNPASIGEYTNDVDLVLSAHTHRGQIFPANFITGLIYEVDHGHFQRDEDSPHFIVTQGVHTVLTPMRVGTNSEIASVLVR